MAKKKTWKTNLNFKFPVKNERLVTLLIDLSLDQSLASEFNSGDTGEEAVMEAYGLHDLDRGALRLGSKKELQERLKENVQVGLSVAKKARSAGARPSRSAKKR